MWAELFNHTTSSNGLNQRSASPEQIEEAILQTVAYGDVFEYPLTPAEIHRYLVGVAATLPEIVSVLAPGRLVSSYLGSEGGYYTLAGKEKSVALRRERSLRAMDMWPAATGYGRLISQLPFVRMVAVTGSLAMNNPTERDDIDYLIVTTVGRVWLCRALVIGIVRFAARKGFNLCPNYFVAENSLLFRDQDLYTAHELTQMIPLSGYPVYLLMRRENQWTSKYLPNASGPPRCPGSVSNVGRFLRTLTELPLLGPHGRWLDDREMSRIRRKLGPDLTGSSEYDFGKNWCKGHFHGHHGRTLNAYDHRLKSQFVDKGEGGKFVKKGLPT